MAFRDRLLATIRAARPVLEAEGILIVGSEVPNLLQPDAASTLEEPSVWTPRSGDLLELKFLGIDPGQDPTEGTSWRTSGCRCSCSGRCPSSRPAMRRASKACAFACRARPGCDKGERYPYWSKELDLESIRWIHHGSNPLEVICE